MFDYVLNGTCVISLQFSRVEFTANHEFVPATFHCERKNKSSVILKPVSCVMFPISDSVNITAIPNTIDRIPQVSCVIPRALAVLLANPGRALIWSRTCPGVIA